MTIFDTWTIYKGKMEGEFLKFNQATKTKNFEIMTAAKDQAKKIYLKFIELLKEESITDRNAFKDVLNDFAQDLRKMSDYIKNNEGKKIMEGKATSEKEEIENNLMQAIVKEKPNVKWEDVAGLSKAKQALKEAVMMPLRFPEFFTGQRKPWKGILLYGPPGTGKTFLAKACANEMGETTFFSVSSGDIMSKWVGESEKIVKNLFEMARRDKSSIVFIDEIDSMAGNRREGDNQSSKRVKTEFLVQMDGVGADKQGNRLLVLGATNLPWDLDPAIRRRFERRIYIPLPELETRYNLIKKLCNTTPNTLTQDQFNDLADKTVGFSGSDIVVLIKDAVYEPLRICQKARKFKITNVPGYDAWTPVPPSENQPGIKYFQGKLNDLVGKLYLPDLEYKHFIFSLTKVKPSVNMSQIKRYEQFTEQYGQQG